uniref:Uncharacterized protein n=1 Tax=Knipowitschia caucasica TaxID=637954 RepID=A0AAV2L881_KNICA
MWGVRVGLAGRGRGGTERAARDLCTAASESVCEFGEGKKAFVLSGGARDQTGTGPGPARLSLQPQQLPLPGGLTFESQPGQIRWKVYGEGQTAEEDEEGSHHY